jgi:hypothetical protein
MPTQPPRRDPPRPLSPRTIQIIGLALLIAFAVLWFVTGREDADLIFASGGLVATGQTWDSVARVFEKIDRTHQARHPGEDAEGER